MDLGIGEYLVTFQDLDAEQQDSCLLKEFLKAKRSVLLNIWNTTLPDTSSLNSLSLNFSTILFIYKNTQHQLFTK